MPAISYLGWFFILFACWILSGPVIIATLFFAVVLKRAIRRLTGGEMTIDYAKVASATPAFKSEPKPAEAVVG